MIFAISLLSVVVGVEDVVGVVDPDLWWDEDDDETAGGETYVECHNPVFHPKQSFLKVKSQACIIKPPQWLKINFIDNISVLGT